MLLTIDRATLASAVKFARLAIAPKPADDILGHMLLDARADGTLAVTASDGDILAEMAVAAEVKSAGRATVPASTFVSMLAQVGATSLTVALDKGRVRLTGTGTKLALPTLDPGDFPDTSHWGELREIAAVDAADLRAAVAASAFAAAANPGNPILAGVHLILGAESLELVAVDGMRFAAATIVASPRNDTPPLALTVPAKALAAMVAALPDGPLIVALAGTTLVLVAPTCRAYARTLDGAYPNYRQWVPQSCATAARAPRVALRDAARLAGIAAGDAKGATGTISRLTLTIGPAGILVAGQSAEEDAEIVVPLTVPIEGQMRLALDGRALTAALEAIGGDEAELRANSPIELITVLPALREGAGATSLHGITPLQLR